MATTRDLHVEILQRVVQCSGTVTAAGPFPASKCTARTSWGWHHRFDFIPFLVGSDMAWNRSGATLPFHLEAV